MSKKYPTPLLRMIECKEIVNKFNRETNNNLEVTSFTIVPATEAKGFLGEYFQLTIDCLKQINTNELTINNGNKASILLKFFVKSLPFKDEEHETVRIFSKETSLYDSLLPKLQKYSASNHWCPKVYLSQKSLLVLEDLASRDFYSLASKDTLTEDEMFPVLNGLAAMHASSLLYEFETNDNIGEAYSRSLEEITFHPDVIWYITGLKTILEVAKHHSKFQTKVSQSFITSQLPLHLENVYGMANTSSKYRNVLCHRDTWGGNIFLNRSNPLMPAVFVDFQTCRYSPAAIDVIFTLFLNLSKQERLQKQCEYLKYYYRQLIQHVKNYTTAIGGISLSGVVFSEEEFLESFEEFMLLGFVYRALTITILKVPEEYVTDYYKYVERSKILLSYMKENEDFRRLMEECIEDIIVAVTDI